MFLFCLSPFYLTAENDTIPIHVKWEQNNQVNLSSGATIETLWIEDAVTRPQTGLLPWIAIPLDLPNGFRPDEIQVIVRSFDTLYYEAGNEPVDLFSAQKEFIWRMFENVSNGTAIYQLQLLPLRSANNQFERLIDATIVFKASPEPIIDGDSPPLFADQSVLSEGHWIRIGITESGVYKIGYDDLALMGLQPDEIDPRNIGIFGNGGYMLPEQNSISRYDDLFENSIMVAGESDGSFDSEDAIYFYAESPIKWSYVQYNTRFKHAVNYYSDTTFYFLNVKSDAQGKRIQSKPQSNLASSREITTFLDRQYHERDLENLIKSGKEWFGEEFTKNHPNRNFIFNFPNRVIERPAYFDIHFAGRSISESFYFSAQANGQQLVNPTMLLQLGPTNAVHARDSYQSASFLTDSDQVDVEVSIQAENDNSMGWLNYIRLNSWRYLYYENEHLKFRNPESVGSEVISLFRISGCNENLFLWDVTDPLMVKKQEFDYSEGQINFKVATDSLREYILFSISDAKDIGSFEMITNQNLHAIESCDMLIISHPDFIDNAHELAQTHYEDDGLVSTVINVNEIYNEFGSGIPDVTAIRDFIRMVYLRSDQQLKYVLLFGDASYDYKNIVFNKANFVPTYQGTGSLVETQSFVSDDYFGLMGPNEGNEMDGILDLGIGRFPVANAHDADIMVKKVQHYLDEQRSQMGEWRNKITFVADDKDTNLHLNQAETLAKQVDTAYVNLNIRKIYLDSYKRISVPGGYRYPDANTTLLSEIHDGSLIINYTGHGGITGLSDEKVFTISEIENLNNFDRMPFFITATCEFSRFDNPAFVSAGEQLLLNSNGGGIALMTTTRLAFAHSNFAINRRVYATMFSSDKSEINRLGDIIRASKNPTSTYVYNFVLLGDPALRLTYPKYEVTVTKFNSQILPAPTDTLGAMAEVKLEGYINDRDGTILEGFNGHLFPKMFDKKTSYKTLANDQSSQVALFTYFDKLLYRGRVTVINGRFELAFKLPRDIAYQFGKSKISFYAIDTVDFRDAGGYYDKMVVGGFDETVAIDATGPEIILFANDKNFENGDYASSDAVIYVQISDPQGIHFLGTSIGRDIVLTHESAVTDKFIVNHLFETSFDNSNTGSFIFPLTELENGVHKIKIKAWDLHNNSSEKEIWFIVDQNAGVSIREVINYPNPFAEETKFVFSHNKPNELLDIQIDIFNQMGSWVASLNEKSITEGSRSEPVRWDGKDASGRKLSPGLYVYRLSVRDAQGKTASVYQRFIFSKN